MQSAQLFLERYNESLFKLYVYTTFCINVTEIALLTMCSGKKNKGLQKTQC